MLFPNDEAETQLAPKDLPGVPLVYVNSTGNSFGRGVFPAGRLQEWGWKIVYDAISSVNVTARAMREFMSTLKATGESGLEVNGSPRCGARSSARSGSKPSTRSRRRPRAE